MRLKKEAIKVSEARVCKMTIREKAKKDQLEARLKKAKEDRDKLDEVIRNIQSQLNTINQIGVYNAV